MNPMKTSSRRLQSSRAAAATAAVTFLPLAVSIEEEALAPILPLARIPYWEQLLGPARQGLPLAECPDAKITFIAKASGADHKSFQAASSGRSWRPPGVRWATYGQPLSLGRTR